MCKAIIFDHGGVLVEDLVGKYYAANVRRISETQRQKYSDLDFRATRGQVEEEEYRRTFDEVFGSGEFEKLDKVQKEKDASPDPGLERLITTLKLKYKIGLLSNNYAFWSRWIRRQPYMNLFDAVVFSDEVGVAKPDQRIYGIMAEKLSVLPNECIFIDNLQANIEGAKNVGMEAVRFTNITALQRQLETLGIAYG